jgi:hypothetical protein
MPLPIRPATPTIVPKDAATFDGMSATNSFTEVATSCSRKYRPIQSLRLARSEA